MAQCQARANHSNERCKNKAEPGKRVCKFHGGRSLQGPASPQWKHGKYSKYLPRHLIDKYEDSLTASLSMREEIAVLDARLADRIESLTNSDSATYMDELARLWLVLTRSKNKAERDAAAVDLDAHIKAGSKDADSWRDVSRLIEQRRKLVDTEVKNLSQVQRMVTLEELVSYIGMLVAAVKESAFEHAQEDVAKEILKDTNLAYGRLIGSGLPGMHTNPTSATYAMEGDAEAEIIQGEYEEVER